MLGTTSYYCLAGSLSGTKCLLYSSSIKVCSGVGFYLNNAGTSCTRTTNALTRTVTTYSCDPAFTRVGTTLDCAYTAAAAVASCTPTPSVTPSSTITPSGTSSPTSTKTPSSSRTPSTSVTGSTTATPSSSVTASRTASPSVSASHTPSSSGTPSRTGSVSCTPSVTPSFTVTPSVTPSHTGSTSVSSSVTPTASGSPTRSASATASASVTPSFTPSKSRSATSTPYPSDVSHSPSPVAICRDVDVVVTTRLQASSTNATSSGVYIWDGACTLVSYFENNLNALLPAAMGVDAGIEQASVALASVSGVLAAVNATSTSSAQAATPVICSAAPSVGPCAYACQTTSAAATPDGGPLPLPRGLSLVVNVTVSGLLAAAPSASSTPSAAPTGTPAPSIVAVSGAAGTAGSTGPGGCRYFTYATALPGGPGAAVVVDLLREIASSSSSPGASPSASSTRGGRIWLVEPSVRVLEVDTSNRPAAPGVRDASGSDSSTALGAALGSVLGAIALMAGVIFAASRRRKRREKARAGAAGIGGAGGGVAMVKLGSAPGGLQRLSVVPGGLQRLSVAPTANPMIALAAAGGAGGLPGGGGGGPRAMLQEDDAFGTAPTLKPMASARNVAASFDARKMPGMHIKGGGGVGLGGRGVQGGLVVGPGTLPAVLETLTEEKGNAAPAGRRIAGVAPPAMPSPASRVAAFPPAPHMAHSGGSILPAAPTPSDARGPRMRPPSMVMSAITGVPGSMKPVRPANKAQYAGQRVGYSGAASSAGLQPPPPLFAMAGSNGGAPAHRGGIPAGYNAYRHRREFAPVLSPAQGGPPAPSGAAALSARDDEAW